MSLLPSASMAGLDTIVDEGEEGLEGPGQATKQGGPGGDVSVDVDGVQAYATVLPSHTPAPPFSSSPVGLAWAGGPAGGNELGGGGKPARRSRGEGSCASNQALRGVAEAEAAQAPAAESEVEALQISGTVPLAEAQLSHVCL